MTLIDLPYNLIDFQGALNHHTSTKTDYDAAVTDIVNFFKDRTPQYNEDDVRREVNGYYLRAGIFQRNYRIREVEVYIRQTHTEAYEEIAPFDIGEGFQDLSARMISVLLLKYPDLMPGINRIFFQPEPLPQIRSGVGGMREFVDSVRYSIAANNWFGALFMALALPDICGVLTEGEGVQVGVRYRNWFNKYLKIKYDPANEYEALLSYAQFIPQGSNPLDSMDAAAIEALKQTPVRNAHRLNFTAADCYGFRCKALHQGLAQRSADPSTGIQFSPTQGATIHRSFSSGKWWLSISIFCEDVCKAVEEWLVDVEHDTSVQERLAELMTI